jgi:hypothetical protein
MKYAAEISSGAMIHTRFHKDWFSHSEVDGGKYRQHGDRICLLSFFQNEGSRLKSDSVEGGLTNQPPLDSCIEADQVTAN